VGTPSSRSAYSCSPLLNENTKSHPHCRYIRTMWPLLIIALCMISVGIFQWWGRAKRMGGIHDTQLDVSQRHIIRDRSYMLYFATAFILDTRTGQRDTNDAYREFKLPLLQQRLSFEQTPVWTGPTAATPRLMLHYCCVPFHN
jgi:hypothetical protein